MTEKQVFLARMVELSVALDEWKNEGTDSMYVVAAIADLLEARDSARSIQATGDELRRLKDLGLLEQQ